MTEFFMLKRSNIKHLQDDGVTEWPIGKINYIAPFFIVGYNEVNSATCKFCYIQLMQMEIGMANHVDPDPTTPEKAAWSGSTMFA